MRLPQAAEPHNGLETVTTTIAAETRIPDLLKNVPSDFTSQGLVIILDQSRKKVEMVRNW